MTIALATCKHMLVPWYTIGLSPPTLYSASKSIHARG
jgi:hypothetical protein